MHLMLRWQVFVGSAKAGTNVAAIKSWAVEQLPLGPTLYPKVTIWLLHPGLQSCACSAHLLPRTPVPVREMHAQQTCRCCWCLGCGIGGLELGSI